MTIFDGCFNYNDSNVIFDAMESIARTHLNGVITYYFYDGDGTFFVEYYETATPYFIVDGLDVDTTELLEQVAAEPCAANKIHYILTFFESIMKGNK